MAGPAAEQCLPLLLRLKEARKAVSSPVQPYNPVQTSLQPEVTSVLSVAQLRGREYQSYWALLADFELICANAMAFNQKRSRVYKRAEIVLKTGKKLFAADRALICAALEVLHPAGRVAAQAEDVKAEAEYRTARSQAAAKPAALQLISAGWLSWIVAQYVAPLHHPITHNFSDSRFSTDQGQRAFPGSQHAGQLATAHKVLPGLWLWRPVRGYTGSS